ncbi:MAG: peptide/nickel transport system substrate-binding protein [Mycobacteriales bacterium]
MRTSSARRTLLLALSGALALAGAACAKSDRDNSSGGNSSKSTLVFAGSSDPKSLDPAFVSDGESIRVTRNIYEGLVGLKPGTTEVEPKLATEWTASADGTQYTFKLRQGVKFSDGSTFDAAAACFNFDRWYNFKGPLLQSSSLSYYWQAVFGGFATHDSETAPKTSLYKSCSVTDAGTAVVTLTAASGAFLGSLSLPSFAMQSPTALKQYDADKVSGKEDAPSFTGSYWNQHPTGTGPYKLEKWTVGQEVDLVANPGYWGDKPKLNRLVFRIISDNNARLQALENGSVDGYDLVAPQDIKTLQGKGFQLLARPAFNVGYIGFNQKKAPLNNPKIRQAIAYAVNREGLVKNQYPEGSEVAKEFMPPAVVGYADDVQEYAYDPEKAKQLIKDSGVTDLTIEFAYPTDVSRPYMPSPVDNWQLIKSDLEKVGFTVKQRSDKWSPDYNDKASTGAYQMFLLGWTGDYADPDNFIGTFFRDTGVAVSQFGWDDPAIRKQLSEARAEPDATKREAAYKEINRAIMTELPGLPYVHTKPYLAFKSNVKGFVPSPVQDESYSTVSFG